MSTIQTPQLPALPGMSPLGIAPAMPTSLRTLASDDDKRKLRKTRTLPASIKAVVYRNAVAAHCPAVTMQLGQDLLTYGLWEALLYVESYERQGMYQTGTAVAAFTAWRGKGKA